MSNPTFNKGAFSCTLGIFFMAISFAFAAIVFIKCFGLAYQHSEYTLSNYISALFTRDALKMYFFSGIGFFAGLYLFVNGLIRIVKDFFEV